MNADNFEEAFNTWWEPDPDEEEADLPYKDISKKNNERSSWLAICGANASPHGR